MMIFENFDIFQNFRKNPGFSSKILIFPDFSGFSRIFLRSPTKFVSKPSTKPFSCQKKSSTPPRKHLKGVISTYLGESCRLRLFLGRSEA